MKALNRYNVVKINIVMNTLIRNVSTPTKFFEHSHKMAIHNECFTPFYFLKVEIYA